MSVKNKESKSTNIELELDGDTDTRLEREAQKLGKIGLVLGAPENVVVYIAGFIVFTVLFMLGTLMFFDENMRPDLAAAIGTIGVLALGQIGRLRRK